MKIPIELPTKKQVEKEKGNAKKAIAEFLELYFNDRTKTNAISGELNINKMNDLIDAFKEDTKLSPELQKAKINLSADEFETLKKLLEKAKLKRQKIKRERFEFKSMRL